MFQSRLTVLLVAVLSPVFVFGASFASGNLVIYRVGAPGGTLSAAGAAVFLDEYTPDGALVQSIALPMTTPSAGKRLVASGTSTSEGFLTRSADGNYLVLAGYDADAGTANIAGAASATVNRVIGRVDASGAIDTTTALTDAASGGNPRGVASTDGVHFWLSASNGLRYVASPGASTSTSLSTANLRATAVVNGQLYVTSGSGSNIGVNTVGAGTPTSGGQTITLLTGLSGMTSPYGFFFADLDSSVAGFDTLYIADDGADRIFKFSLVGGTWSANGSAGAASDDYRGLTGVVSGGTVTLYATRKGTEFVKLIDTAGYNANFSSTSFATLATAGSGTAFRGVAFAPVSGGGGGSTPPTGSGSASPNPVAAGSSATLSAANSPGTNPTSVSYTNTCNLISIGGGASVALPVSYAVPANTAGNTYNLPCTVTDDQGRSANFTLSLTVLAPPPPLRRIYEITGPGTTSPLAGVPVQTRGVVTAVRGATGSTKGFYIESLPADRDASDATSEGLLVFIGGATLPACANAIGNYVSVVGTVQDFVASGSPAGTVPLTELSGVTSCTSIDSGNHTSELPAAVTITSSLIAAGGPGTQSRKLLGMRVILGASVVVGPSLGSLSEANATSTVGSTFFVSLEGVTRPFHNTPGILETRRPSDARPSVPTWNGNPEAFRIDTTGLNGGASYAAATGTSISAISGIMDYNTGENQYQIYTNAAGVGVLNPAVPTLSATPIPAPLATDLLVVNANLQRFYNDVNNGGDALLTTTAYQGRLKKLSNAVRNVMRMPDIIAVEEVEGPPGNASNPAFPVLQDIVTRINADAAANGQGSPNYDYCGGVTNDIGLIAAAAIYRKDRVSAVNCTQFGVSSMYTQPGGGTATLNDRPPVVFQANVTAPGSDSSLPVRVVVNHLRSLNGIDEPGTANGDRVRAKRNEQAKYAANLISGKLAEQTANWSLTDHLIVAGDMNAFEVSDGYADLVNCIAGAPAPASELYTTQAQRLASPPCTAIPDLALTNLTTTDPLQRYSYNFAGISQRIDHILVNAKANARVRQFAYARNNADFPEGPAYRNNFDRPERFSDHDNPAVYLKLPVEVTSRTRVNTAILALNRVAGRYIVSVSVTNTGPAALTGPVYVLFENLPAGATLPGLPAHNGVPYLTIPLPSGLAPGATSGSVFFSLSNPSNAFIGFTTKQFDVNF